MALLFFQTGSASRSSKYGCPATHLQGLSSTKAALCWIRIGAPRRMIQRVSQVEVEVKKMMTASCVSPYAFKQMTFPTRVAVEVWTCTRKGTLRAHACSTASLRWSEIRPWTGSMQLTKHIANPPTNAYLRALWSDRCRSMSLRAVSQRSRASLCLVMESDGSWMSLT